jgi:hypothetical protein
LTIARVSTSSCFDAVVAASILLLPRAANFATASNRRQPARTPGVNRTSEKRSDSIWTVRWDNYRPHVPFDWTVDRRMQCGRLPQHQHSVGRREDSQSWPSRCVTHFNCTPDIAETLQHSGAAILNSYFGHLLLVC